MTPSPKTFSFSFMASTILSRTAARRVAQLAYDLDFDGTPMLYSWPSQASPTAYAVDEAAVGISGRRMADFLETVVAQSGAEHIHLIAHSMGNRALIEALQTYLARRAPENRVGRGARLRRPTVEHGRAVEIQIVGAVAPRAGLSPRNYC